MNPRQRFSKNLSSKPHNHLIEKKKKKKKIKPAKNKQNKSKLYKHLK